MGGWIRTFINTGVCVCVCRCWDACGQTQIHTGCSLLRNLLVSFVSFYFFNILSKQTKRFTPDMLCAPSLEEKVFDDSINQTAEQGWQCKSHKIQLPLQSKFHSKRSLTPWIQQCQIDYKSTKDCHPASLCNQPSLESCFVCFCCPWMRYWFSRGFLSLQNAYYIKSRLHYILKITKAL